VEGRYFYTRDNGRTFIKLVGSLRYTISYGFDAFIDKLIKEDKFEDVLIDLTETDYIDSTNLGLVAKIGEHVLEKKQKRVTIISTNEDITHVLKSVGFDEFFIIINNPESFRKELYEIPFIKENDIKMAEMILDAHKNLILIAEKNKELFQDVVNLLEEDLKHYKK